jgi:hypothetical protein
MRKSSQVPTPARSDTNTPPSPQKKQHRASKKEKIHYPQMGCQPQNPRKKKQRIERSKLHTCALPLISLPLFLSISHTEVKARNPNIKMLYQKKTPKQ